MVSKFGLPSGNLFDPGLRMQFMAVENASTVGDLNCTVVDADFHMTEQLSDIIEYLESPWDKLFLNKNPFNEGADFYDPFPEPAVMPIHIVTGRSQIFAPDATRTPDDILEGLELLNVDIPLITPGAAMLRVSTIGNRNVAAAFANACNSWVLDKIVDESDSIPGTITIAGQDPELAADEIDDRADEKDMVGVYLPTGGLNPPLGDKSYNPIYEACERHDLPLVMHGAAGASIMKSFPVQWEGFERAMSLHTITHPFQHMVNLVSIVVNGVPERFDVDLIFQEAGIGWIPFVANRLDKEYYQRRQDASLLTKPPSEYVLNDFNYTTQPLEGLEENPDYVCSTARQMNAPETLMWSSDYPHHDFDDSDTVFRALAREFDDEELANIFGNNAMEVLRT